MNAALILAGGVGMRLLDATIVPKQYCLIEGIPLIMYCLRTFQRNARISVIVIVADRAHEPFLEEWMQNEKIDKFHGFATPGENRQLSIYNGLKRMSEVVASEDVVLVHDAVRPLVSASLIDACIHAAQKGEGAMPVLKITDTIYQSNDGYMVKALLNRDELFAGQTPEGFRFGEYLAAYERLSEEEIAKCRGSSEIAFRAGMKIRMIPGSAHNIKITTASDLETFVSVIISKGQEA